MMSDAAIEKRSEQLHHAACQATGLDDFGADDYHEALGRLLDAYETEATLTDAGWQGTADQLVGALIGRLVSEHHWKTNPAWRRATVQRPLVIVGLPRTGTTALHELLAQDPRNQGLELWLAQSPKPRPPREVWDQDPAFVSCHEATSAIYEAQPELRAIHDMAADRADECWHLFRQSFTTITFECVAHIPSYSAWLATHDMSAAYQRHRDNLRLIGSPDTHRRWVLKDPSHLFAPEALIAAYPDALIVQTHRAPREVIPSVCSLNAGFQRGASDAYDPHILGATQMQLWARGIRGFVDARRLVPPSQVFDVYFDDFVQDPIGTVAALYDHFDLQLTTEAEEQMRHWQNASRPGGHGEHHYRLEDFGLVADEIDEVFADYLDMFGLSARSGRGR